MEIQLACYSEENVARGRMFDGRWARKKREAFSRANYLAKGVLQSMLKTFRVYTVGS